MAVLTESAPELPRPRCHNTPTSTPRDKKSSEGACGTAMTTPRPSQADSSIEVDSEELGVSHSEPDSELEPKNAKKVQKVRFQLPECFLEEICDSDHPKHKSIRATLSRHHRDKHKFYAATQWHFA
eukprot:gnl/MRDRNA2_/MRDRNA2_266188_c0_seq1.p1 gnl/MRDRNA2_/MRDRNA2_266188_c0~~gnl/MRDRNA2_/MRDRNA2_266188_c0_seq1.p1  ORF type:complete len:126 (-),score=20.12 gnl/MRDRNA2_/MRDRNA2_266188_c0_seq1:12-389(-)